MTLVRKINRSFNKLLFPLIHKWIFIYNGRVGIWTPVTKEIVGKKYLLRDRRDYPKAVETHSVDITSLYEFLSRFGCTRAAITAFVHSIPYTADIREGDGSDWAKTPSETLVTGEADCEDLSILYVSLMRHKGFDAHLVWLQRPSGYSGLNHMVACTPSLMVAWDAVRVSRNGFEYALQDCTCIRALGDIPDKYRSWARTFLDCSEVDA